jgi:hypothetical protein
LIAIEAPLSKDPSRHQDSLFRSSKPTQQFGLTKSQVPKVPLRISTVLIIVGMEYLHTRLKRSRLLKREFKVLALTGLKESKNWLASGLA